MGSFPRGIFEYACVHDKVLQFCPSVYDPMHSSLPGSGIHGILQARILECVAMPSSRASSQPRDPTRSSCIAGGFLTTGPPEEAPNTK